MTVVLDAPRSAPEEPRKRWTRTEYRQLIEMGFLENGKVELVNGEIWEKMGQGRRHTFVVTRLFKLLGLIFGFDRIQSQSSLPVAEDSDPEPDLAVLTQEMDQYLEVDPTPKDMLLVVEASNTTLYSDMSAKQVMYARSGIPEYWVVDIPNRLLHVFREPNPDGYASEAILNPDEEVRSLAAPDAAIRVADLLP